MQSRQTNMRKTTLRPLVAALATLTCGVAWADEPTPWYVGASQSFTHDSNVYRLADGVAPNDGRGRGDNYWSSGLLGGFDQPIGRQRFYGAANVQYNKYQDHDLSNTSYGLNAGWDWETIEKLSGNINASANQSLASLNGNSVAQSNDRSIVRTEQLATTVRWGGVGRLGLEGNYGHSRVHYADSSGTAAAAANDSTGDTASLGVNYNLNPDLRVGTAVRFVHTVVANGLVVPNSNPVAYDDSVSNSRNLDLTTNWQLTAQTGVAARLSWTRQTYSGTSNQSFSGLTGSFSGRYAPTAKLSFTAAYSRDAGTNGSFFNVVPTNTPNSTQTTLLSEGSQVTDGYSLGANYAATAKINVTAGYDYRNAKIANAFAGTTLSDYNDKFRIARLGVSYAITRSVQLSCNLSHETRDVSSTPGFAYSANVVGCSGTLTLR